MFSTKNKIEKKQPSPKINMSPEKGPFRKQNRFPSIFFSVAMFMLVLGQSVSVDDFYATNQPFLLLFCVLSLSR